MAAQVGGLRSVQSQRVLPKYDRGERPLVNTESRPEGLRPVATPVSRYSAPPVAPRDDRLNQLADALSSLNPALQKWGALQAENKEKEQAAKLPAFIEQIKRDRGTGAINAAQVGEIFPELVPTIRWRIAQAIGEEAGAASFAPIIEQINTNENLLFNSEARKAFIEEQRSKLFAQIGGGNDFYEAGFVSAFDKSIASWELNWQRQTAGKHMEIMGNQWQREATEAFLAGGPEAVLKKDSEWANSGGLHHTTRNKLFIDQISEIAYREDNPELLDKIPQRFLNADSKLQIAKAKAQIEEHRKAQWRFGIQMQEHQRSEEIRSMKTEALERFFKGEVVNPADYRKHPEVADYVTSLLNRPRVHPVSSQARATHIRSEILKAATFGDFSRLGVPGDLFNEAGLIDLIQNDAALNGDDAGKLIAEVPKLLEGVALLRDDSVRQQIGDRLRPVLDSLNQSIPGSVNKVVGGRSLYAWGMETFQQELQKRFTAYYEQSGNWPRGFEKQDMIDAALERAEAMVLRLADPRNMSQTLNDAKNPGKPQASAPTAATKGGSREVSGRITESGATAQQQQTSTTEFQRRR